MGRFSQCWELKSEVIAAANVSTRTQKFELAGQVRNDYVLCLIRVEINEVRHSVQKFRPTSGEMSMYEFGTACNWETGFS